MELSRTFTMSRGGSLGLSDQVSFDTHIMKSSSTLTICPYSIVRLWLGRDDQSWRKFHVVYEPLDQGTKSIFWGFPDMGILITLRDKIVLSLCYLTDAALYACWARGICCNLGSKRHCALYLMASTSESASCFARASSLKLPSSTHYA